MLITLIVFIIILGFLVFAHEFGHFVVAKRLGVKVEEFGLGFPPRAIGIQKINCKGWRLILGNKPASDFQDGGTIYSLNLIPLGGFVKIKGESGEYHHDEDSFANKKVWQRMSILSAGVIMNIIASIMVLSIGFWVGLPRVISEGELIPYAKIKNRHIEIVEVLANSPASLAGIEVGDILVSIDKTEITSSAELNNYLKNKLNVPLTVEIRRNSNIIKKEITPVVLKETGEPGVGIGYVEVGDVVYSPFLAVWHGITETAFYIKEIVKTFCGVIYHLVIGEKVSVDIAGPVGIAVFTGKVVRLGFAYLLMFTALLSVNLALINIFPFPALDGGRLFFLVLEGIRRRPVPQRVENMIHNIGFALLMILIIFVTYRDITKFGGGFLDRIKTLMR